MPKLMSQPYFEDYLRVGIHAISSFQPSCIVPNEWYETMMARKFVKHTGILRRAISDRDEVGLARCVLEALVHEHSIDLGQCAGLVFVTPSAIPQPVAKRYMDGEAARREQPTRMAMRLVDSTAMAPRYIRGINGFCSGYAKALELVQDKVLPQVQLEQNEFVLVVTSNCISRITDFEDRQSGALFGDFATVTVISRQDSSTLPVRFELLDAHFQKVAVPRAYFEFTPKSDVLTPSSDGGRRREAQRLVFGLDGMGIADTAPRAMAEAAAEMASDNRLEPEQVQHIVPHQAGDGIVRLTGMKLEEAGFATPPINGLTAETGNISSGSVPYALLKHWDSLTGNILCPVAAVGAPGKPEVSRGCILLRSRLAAASSSWRRVA